MTTIQQFTKEFNYRHDFSYDDIDFLPKKFSNITFNNIPEAWVCEIDRVFTLLNKADGIKSVSQIMGFLVIDFDHLSRHDVKLLHGLDEQIKLLDIDLYKQFETTSLLN
jgi:hypothetical protein